jgi:hypothetical protein
MVKIFSIKFLLVPVDNTTLVENETLVHPFSPGLILVSGLKGFRQHDPK